MLKEIIKKMQEYPNEFKFNDQKNSNIESFFRDELNCQHVPTEVLEFYRQYDGFNLTFVNEIFSLDSIKREYESIDEFLEFMDISDNTRKFIPIADDGMGGLYVFSSGSNDECIYYLDHEYPEEIVKFESFSNFLENEYEIAMDILENE